MGNKIELGTMIAFVGVVLVTSPAMAYTVGKACIEEYSPCDADDLPNACDEADLAGDFGGSVSFYSQNYDVFLERHGRRHRRGK